MNGAVHLHMNRALHLQMTHDCDTVCTWTLHVAAGVIRIGLHSVCHCHNVGIVHSQHPPGCQLVLLTCAVNLCSPLMRGLPTPVKVTFQQPNAGFMQAPQNPVCEHHLVVGWISLTAVCGACRDPAVGCTSAELPGTSALRSHRADCLTFTKIHR